VHEKNTKMVQYRTELVVVSLMFEPISYLLLVQIFFTGTRADLPYRKRTSKTQSSNQSQRTVTKHWELQAWTKKI
jgi:hypothetical protein